MPGHPCLTNFLRSLATVAFRPHLKQETTDPKPKFKMWGLAGGLEALGWDSLPPLVLLLGGLGVVSEKEPALTVRSATNFKTACTSSYIVILLFISHGHSDGSGGHGGPFLGRFVGQLISSSQGSNVRVLCFQEGLAVRLDLHSLEADEIRKNIIEGIPYLAPDICMRTVSCNAPPSTSSEALYNCRIIDGNCERWLSILEQVAQAEQFTTQDGQGCSNSSRASTLGEDDLRRRLRQKHETPSETLVSGMPYS